MIASRVLLATLVAFASSLGANAQNVFCGGAGYDVSNTALRDMSWNSTGYTYWIRPCGAVTAASDPQCTVPSEAPYGAMLCQRERTGAGTYVLSNWNQTVAQFQSKWYALPQGGVQLDITNGDVCGNRFRTTSIVFRCNAQAVTPALVSVTEPETCMYQAVVETSQACAPVGNTQSNVVGSSFFSNQCGAGYYDFTTLRNKDMFYDAEGFNFWLRMCESVTAVNCTRVQPTSFCQQRDADPTAYDLSDWNATTPALYTITPTGVDVMIRTGDMCGAFPRKATYSLQCNPRANAPYISYVEEYQTCHYKAVIQTRAVCTGTNDPARGYCGGAGYDLSGLQQADMQLVTGGYEWNLHPCGIISPWFTDKCRDRDSMFCQTPVGSPGGWSLATWNRNVSRAATWIAIENGVQLYVSNSGESCGGVIRDTTINFICNRTAKFPWFSKVSEPAMCWYVAEVHTEHVCDAVGSTAENVPGSSFWSNQCGGGVWDVSDIRDEPLDLTFDSNVTSATSGHMYYFELCGQVVNPACASVQPTMFCQVDKSNTSWVWSLSGHTEGKVQKYTINENGFTMSLQDGTPCGGLGNRSTDIQVVCDGTTPALVSSFREIETCHYVAVVRGRCSRGSTEPFSSTGRKDDGVNESSSSSSKLSGGAIAGIVIGSIVGALILLAVLFFVCCGAASYRGGKKNNFTQQEDSRVETGEVEMEDSTR